MQMKNSTRHSFFYTSQMVLVIKNPLANAGNAGSISGSGDPLEEGMATHSSILFWRIPWTEEPGGLQSMGSQRVRHDWSDLACTPTRWYQGAIAHLIWAYLEKNRLCSLSESNPFQINYGENVLPKDSHLIKILFKKISPFETLEFFRCLLPRDLPCLSMTIFPEDGWRRASRFQVSRYGCVTNIHFCGTEWLNEYNSITNLVGKNDSSPLCVSFPAEN